MRGRSLARLLLALLVVPATLAAQDVKRDSTGRRTGDSLAVFVPPSLLGVPVPFAHALLEARRAPGSPLLPRPARDTVAGADDIGFRVQTRIETKGERTRNERCSTSQLLDPFAACRTRLQPDFDLQLFLKSAGTFGDRFHVDVDYDTQREFDASQTLSLFYQGNAGDRVERVELGNVTFAPPPSRFITASIPSGNYGAQAIGRIGRLQLRAIAAQQKGNVVQNRTFLIGERTLHGNDREIEDYQIEARRFFFTVDPALFEGEYPNVDILDRAQLERIRRRLPDTLRPTRVVLYRLQFGTQPLDPNGPSFSLVDGAESGVQSVGRQTYDVLREGLDYVLDPSNLWFTLVRPLNSNNERLVVAYYVRLAGATRDTVWATTGGTPDLSRRTEPQLASLIWDPRAQPETPAFRKEIRSVYRIAGSDLQRPSARIRIVAGGGQQEQPTGGGSATYLEMFGLAQRNNSAEFDVENRLWPRTGDPVYNATAGAGPAGAGSLTAVAAGGQLGAGGGSRIISDYFLVFPSTRPFARRDSGLVALGNASNDAIYTTPGEYLYSPQHPPSVYRIIAQYDAAGSTAAGSLDLGSVQLRRGSERIIVDGRALTRDVDYRVDYETGRLSFLRPDTLFQEPRRVEVRFEENPLFAPSPTRLLGLTSELPLPHGQLSFTALSQSQRTTFTRPQLGFEPTSALLAGVSGQFAWSTPWLSRLMSKLSLPFTPGISAAAPSRVAVQGEIAASQPAANSSAQAYIESFEGEAGLRVDLRDVNWYYGSVPPRGHGGLPLGFLPDVANATQLAWQTNGMFERGRPFTVSFPQIDPRVEVAETGFSTPEPLLWLTLYPDTIGRLAQGTDRPDWVTPRAPAASTRRWRSLRTVLNPSGVDLSRSDYLEFWAFVDTSAVYRAHNPVLVFDIGDIGEASLAFRPETLFVGRTGADSAYRGKRVQGLDSLDTERDAFSRAFSAGVNDVGLPGDRLDTLVVVDSARGGAPQRVADFTMCRNFYNALLFFGDTRGSCTAGNNRLDEEDIDLDNALNLTFAQREEENIRRYVVDLADPRVYARVGGEFEWPLTLDKLGPRTRQWVLVRVPLHTPADTLGSLQLRRVRAMRLTMVSGSAAGDEEFTQIALARVSFGGTPWVKRADAPLAGIAGTRPASGFVATSLIGTNDYDPQRGVFYEPPPGYRNQLQSRSAQTEPGVFQINERSLRIQAGGLALYDRAEAFYRFPGGQQNFMGYRELRLWARGRGHGWGGPSAELQLFVKIGRDENNFYLYRAPANEGQDVGAWNPEVRVEFERFYDLRRRVENAFLGQNAAARDSLACTGVDSALVVASGLPTSQRGGTTRFAACDGTGYILYTLDPAITAPNLSAVQEMSVGIVRVAEPGAGAPNGTAPGDTLELWVNEIRLARVVGSAGVAGQFGINVVGADFADVRVNLTRRDPHFRQLTELPSYTDERALEVAGTFRLERLLPMANGFSLPLTIVRTSTTADPLFLAQSDIRGRGIAGLRSPRNVVTRYSLTVRRTTPIGHTIFGPLLNNLAVTSSYVDGGSRTEYQTGSTRNFSTSLDYLVADSARSARLPGLLDRVFGSLPGFLQAGPVGALRNSVFRWNPSQLRFTSGLVRGTDRRRSFSTPIETEDDVGRDVLALTNVWRTGSVLELRPTNGFTARWEIASVRDLRQYGDSNAAALVAGADRSRFLGGDAGFERERLLQTSVTLAPQFSRWFRPRAEFGTQYTMLRDPNARFLLPKPGVIGVDSLLAHLDSIRLVRPDSIVSVLTLPRRLMATQAAGAGITVDIARALLAYGDTTRGSLARRLGRVFAPVDVSLNRSLLTAFDAAAFRTPVGLQFGFGGPGAFRTVSGVPASSAGATTTLVATSALSLPFGTSFTNRYRRTLTRNWVLRLDSTQARVDGTQTVFPDVSLRWVLHPQALERVLSSFTASLGYSAAAATSSLPIGNDPLLPGNELRELRTTHVRSYPLNTSITWGFGNLSTSAGYTYARRVDSLSGSLARGTARDLNVDVGRSFRIPSGVGNAIGVRNEVRARVGYQRSHSQNLVSNLSGQFASRLGDQVRDALNVNADTELSETLLFTFQASRVVSADNNLNRRVNQLVLSTVLQVQFFGGPQAR